MRLIMLKYNIFNLILFHSFICLFLYWCHNDFITLTLHVLICHMVILPHPPTTVTSTPPLFFSSKIDLALDAWIFTLTYEFWLSLCRFYRLIGENLTSNICKHGISFHLFKFFINTIYTHTHICIHTKWHHLQLQIYKYPDPSIHP